jgi:hypothetical protein
MITDARPSEESRFDHLLDPEDIIDRLRELRLEAIITPDGRWNETEAGQLWDDDAWLARARNHSAAARLSRAAARLPHLRRASVVEDVS